MRLFLPFFLLFLVFAIAKPVHKPTSSRARGASNAFALQNKLALPRPASLPPRCSRSNATCIAEVRRPRLKRQAPHPSSTSIPAHTGSYQETCTDISLSGSASPFMRATCKTQTGESAVSEFKLANCVSYGIAGLRCNYKIINILDFERQCSDCKLVGTRLDCKCGIFRNSVDLANCMGNENGRLACRPYLGIF